MTTDGKAQFEARMKRFSDSVTMQKPDRVPVCPLNFHFFPAVVNGMSMKDAMVDHPEILQPAQKEVLHYEFDMAPACSVYPAPTWEALGVKTWKWPGHDLDDNRIFQFIEQEVMKADEYDRFLSDPDGFTLPRVVPPNNQSLRSDGDDAAYLLVLQLSLPDGFPLSGCRLSPRCWKA